jgi:hypothetical protein
MSARYHCSGLQLQMQPTRLVTTLAHKERLVRDEAASSSILSILQASLRNLKKRGTVFARIRYEPDMTAGNADDLAAKPIA